MTTRKTRFIELCTCVRMSTEAIAVFLGRPFRTTESWRQPGDVRQPPQEVVDKMEALYLEILRRDVRAAGYEMIKRKA